MTERIRRLADWDDERLRELANDHGTPLYVLDLERVRDNYDRLADAFENATVKYAAKANAGQHVLDTLVDAGAGIECGSPGEVERALAAGGDPDRLQYTAVNPPAAGLDLARDVAEGAPSFVVTAGAMDTVDRLADRGFDGRLFVRVNPDVGAGHHEKVITGTNPKFGVPADRLNEVLGRAADRDLNVSGLHGHIGSGLLDADVDRHAEFCRRMRSFVTDAPLAIDTVDIGGGLGVPYRESDDPLDLDVVAGATREIFDAVDVEVVIEPGRYVVADAGVLLGRVNTVKPAGDRSVVGVDVGMTTLLRPALYDAYHPLGIAEHDADERPETNCLVGGPICESSDVLTEDRSLPRPERGDLLAIGNAGAYGYEMALQFHSQPRPGTVALEEDRSWLARRRETVADLTRVEIDRPWGDDR